MDTVVRGRLDIVVVTAVVIILLIRPPAADAWSLNKILLTGPKLTSDNQSLTPDPGHSNRLSYLLVADSVTRGVHVALTECRHQFRWEPWDCPNDIIPQVLNGLQLPVTRELSFVQATLAAGVMYVVAQNCSVGQLYQCGCHDMNAIAHVRGEQGNNWEWSGCREHVHVGDHVTRKLLDGIVTSSDRQAALASHNHRVGRRAVWRTLKVRCKCHGVSGSCVTRTCWYHLAQFRAIGNALKRKYAKAAEVSVNSALLPDVNTVRRRAKGRFSRQLVFSAPSPDYCRPVPPHQHPGTQGRECTRPPKGARVSRAQRRSCRTLCTECGLRVRKYTLETSGSCNCRFQWCCAVRCKTCTQIVTKHYCHR